MSACRCLVNGFFCECSPRTWTCNCSRLYWFWAVSLNAMLFELSSSEMDSEPFRNGLVHDFGPLLIFATTSERLICATPQLAGLENCRLVIGRGMTVLLSFTSLWLSGKIQIQMFLFWSAVTECNKLFCQQIKFTLEFQSIFAVMFLLTLPIHGVWGTLVRVVRVVAVFLESLYSKTVTERMFDHQAYNHDQSIRNA